MRLFNIVSSDRESLNVQDTEEAVMRTFDFLEAIPKSKSDGKPPAELNVGDADASWPDDMGGKSASERNSGNASFVYGLDESTNPNSVKRFGRKAGLDHNLKNERMFRTRSAKRESQKAEEVERQQRVEHARSMLMVSPGRDPSRLYRPTKCWRAHVEASPVGVNVSGVVLSALSCRRAIPTWRAGLNP
nr:unnamed protein product [Spirometra erinaceieuropaei]